MQGGSGQTGSLGVLAPGLERQIQRTVQRRVASPWIRPMTWSEGIHSGPPCTQLCMEPQGTSQLVFPFTWQTISQTPSSDGPFSLPEAPVHSACRPHCRIPRLLILQTSFTKNANASYFYSALSSWRTRELARIFLLEVTVGPSH